MNAEGRGESLPPPLVFGFTAPIFGEAVTRFDAQLLRQGRPGFRPRYFAQRSALLAHGGRCAMTTPPTTRILHAITMRSERSFTIKRGKQCKRCGAAMYFEPGHRKGGNWFCSNERCLARKRGKPRPKPDPLIPLGPPKPPRPSEWNEPPFEDAVIELTIPRRRN